MKNIVLFIDYKLIANNLTPEQNRSALNACFCHQFVNGEMNVPHIFTALDIEEGIAFSQKYQKHENDKCSHGHMFKHESGIDNPCDPSFDELVKQIKKD